MILGIAGEESASISKPFWTATILSILVVDVQAESTAVAFVAEGVDLTAVTVTGGETTGETTGVAGAAFGI
jgi:hypothetical protein